MRADALQDAILSPTFCACLPSNLVPVAGRGDRSVLHRVLLVIAQQHELVFEGQIPNGPAEASRLQCTSLPGCV